MDVEIEVGSPLTLTVSITEFNLEIAESDILWTRNGIVLMDQVNGFSISSTGLNTPPGMSMLTLGRVETPDLHSGAYIVNATNPAGFDTSTFSVTVTGEYFRCCTAFCIVCDFLYQYVAPPNITNPVEDMDVTAIEGENAIIACTAIGFPAPTITWYRGVMENDRIALNGMLGPTTMMDGFFVVTSMLTISDVARSDSGLYSCVAENTFGPSRSASRIFNLTVYCKYVVLSFSP